MIGVRQLRQKAAAILELIETKGDQAFATVLVPHFQSVLNLMRNVVGQFKKEHPDQQEVIALLEAQVAADSNSPDGLSDTSRSALILGTQVLAAQMRRDYAKGQLNIERITLLLAGGAGGAIVGAGLLEPIRHLNNQ